MAAPLGFKTFTTGEVLTAADTNGYLMQGVLVFANAAARTSAITSPQEGQTSYLKDTDEIQVYSGSAWVTKSGGLPSQTGNSGKYLTTNGTDASWATVAGGSMTLLSTTALSGTSTTVSGISGSYKNLIVQILGAQAATSSALMLRVNGITTSTYRFTHTQAGLTSFSGNTGQDKQNLLIGDPTTANNNFTQLTFEDYSRANTLKYWSQFATVTTGTAYTANCTCTDLTAAITSITVLENDGYTFTGGTIYIYGVN